MTSSKAYDRASELACEILESARCTLMANFRFLDVALWKMPFLAKGMDRALGTDGASLFYDPVRLARLYSANPNNALRAMLHVILQCVFRHPFDNRHPNLEIWDLACDVACGAISLDLTGTSHPCERDDERWRAAERLKQEAGQLSAGKIYNALLKKAGVEGGAAESSSVRDNRVFEELKNLFSLDEHGVWSRCPEGTLGFKKASEPGALLDGPDDMRLIGKAELFDEDDVDSDETSTNSAGSPAKSKGGEAARGQIDDADRFEAIQSGEEGLPEFKSMDGVRSGEFSDITWQNISKQIQAELEAFEGKYGTDSENFLVNLRISNRKRCDYREFLRRFSTLSEEIKVSTEEFDYVYYTYGLGLYDNIPLIEPLEYQDSNRVKEFVIAVDTSGSCAFGLVKRFVEQSYAVLRSTAGFGRKVNVHIVQCDSQVTKDTKITNINELDLDMSDFTVRGFGGTDFRPVFKYVDELKEQKELCDLKGLIYFTDGIGTYPDKPPGYEVAFIFVNPPPEGRKVPPWACKVLMEEEDIIEL